MWTIGIDLGVRSLHVAVIDDYDKLWVNSYVLPRQYERYQELRYCSKFLHDTVGHKSAKVYIEEPVVAGARNLRTSLQMAQLAGALMSTVIQPAYFVEVTSWKKKVVGSGNASKEDVALWLKEHHMDYSAACEGDQNKVDATCIALYGQAVGMH